MRIWPRFLTRRVVAVLVCLVLVAAACGGDDDDDASASSDPTAQATDGADPTAAPTATTTPDEDSSDTDGAGAEPDAGDPKPEDGSDPLEDLVAGGDDGADTDGSGDDGAADDSGATTEVQGTPGGPGLGDPYYPSLGNGGYNVALYDLDLDWDPEARQLAGTATIDATATQDLSDFNLDLEGMTVSSVTIDGVDAAFVLNEPELTITPQDDIADGTTFQIVVNYSGEPRSAGPVTVIGDGGWTTLSDVAYVAGEPGGAAGWFPVNDHPLDKAQFRMSFTVPEEDTVAANGRLVSETNDGDTTTWVYETLYEQAPYLTTVVIGDLELIEVGESNGVLIRHAIASNLAGIVLPQLESTAEMIDVLSEMFGPYPFETYGIVLIDESLGFALETQTLSIFGRDFLGSPADFQSVLVHELAHQWFGDSLSVAEWDEIWLNEGFATYAQYLYDEAVDPNYDIDAQMDRISRFSPALLENPVPGDPGPADLFATSVYFRGALTLHALRRTIGDDAFFTTVRTYVERNVGGNVETPDLLAVAEEVSGQELDDLFDAWLYTPALPDLPTG